MRNWAGIEEFVVVAEAGSFSGAAASLGVSKSHVSKRVKQLEDRLGVRLIQRTTRSMSLTESGRGYFESCSKLLNNLDDIELALKDKQGNPVGLIRMTVAGAFGEEYLVPLCASFMEQYPNIEIELEFSNRQVDLIEENYDLAIRAGALPDQSSYIVKKLTSYRLITCAAPSYLELNAAPVQPASLSDHDCLIGTLPFWRFKQSDGGDGGAIKISGPWRSNNGRALVNAARAGRGIAQLPEFYVKEWIQAGQLTPVLEGWQPEDISIWAIYPHRQYLPTKVRRLISYLSEHLLERCC